MYQEAQRRTGNLQKARRRRRRRAIRNGLFTGTLCVMFLIILGLGNLIHVWSAELPKESEASAKDTEMLVIVETALVKPKSEGAERMDENEDMPLEKPLLVNKENPLPQDYEVSLITLADGRSKAAEEAYEPLLAMLEAAEEEGIDILICSSYRDRKRQEELFDEDVQKLLRKGYTYTEACQEVAKETMPPGCSEHSTGLAFDIVARDYQMLDEGQEKRAENKWLRKHCAEYGFILRYPKGKEDITQINYESWHFRYVGKEVAEYIMEEGLTLEEYLEKLENPERTY